MENSPSSSITDRKTIERNRRNQMKALYSKLNSLVPHQTSREPVSLPDQLEEAAKYIKKLQTNLEKMKERKNSLTGNEMKNNASLMSDSRTPMQYFRSPQIEIHEMGSALEIALITGLDSQFMFNETIRVLHEEGAEIFNANFSAINDTVFHTIHSKISDSTYSYGAARIFERIKKLVQDANNPF